MTVKQIYELTNQIATETLGLSTVLNEDLSNLVDLGSEVFNTDNVDNYVKALIDRVGKTVFVDRKYNGSVPSVLYDAWEFGSVLEKVEVELPEASENETWELVDGASYDEHIFYKPSVTVRFFNNKSTFEIPYSIATRQVKESFINASEMNKFIGAIEGAVDKAMTIRTDGLIMRTINMMTAKTLAHEIPSGSYGNNSTIKAVNLLKLYNDKFNQSLTKDNCLQTPEFVRFASAQIGITVDRMTKISTLFNIDGKPRFTPKEDMHTVLLSDFVKYADAYLQSGTYHDEYTKLPQAETVPYWQGTGTGYDFDSVSKIHVKVDNDTTVEAGGILGVVFDKYTLAVCNIDKRTTSAYSARGEFYSNFLKYDMQAIASTDENFVVFFVA